MKSARDREIQRKVENLKTSLQKQLDEIKSKKENEEELRVMILENEKDDTKRQELININNQEKMTSERLINEIKEKNENEIKEYEKYLRSKI